MRRSSRQHCFGAGSSWAWFPDGYVNQHIRPHETIGQHHFNNLNRLFCRIILFLYHFYPRSHVGNDVLAMRDERIAENFYPRSHVGNDNDALLKLLNMNEFLSTFPRRERPVQRVFNSGGNRFLSTFPRRERRSNPRRAVRRNHISIHVPT